MFGMLIFSQWISICITGFSPMAGKRLHKHIYQFSFTGGRSSGFTGTSLASDMRAFCPFIRIVRSDQILSWPFSLAVKCSPLTLANIEGIFQAYYRLGVGFLPQSASFIALPNCYPLISYFYSSGN